eukprot:2795565-Rhodomonas_salina.3
MSGTDIAYGAMFLSRRSGTEIAHMLPAYAMSGTEIAYGAARVPPRAFTRGGAGGGRRVERGRGLPRRA